MNACAFSPDGHLALSASSDHTLILWDADRGEEVRRLRGHEGGVHTCAFSPDGRRALSASADRTLILWDAEKWHQVAAIALHGVTDAAFSPDGRRMIVGDGKGHVSCFGVVGA